MVVHIPRIAATGSPAQAAWPVPTAAGRAAGARVRSRFRNGSISGHTSGLGDELVQANLVVLPAADARDFLGYCLANPRPCPLLAVGEPGAVGLPELAQDLDLRTDLPRYRVWRDGELTDEPTDVGALWRDDFVAFAIGCSFTFEWALRAEGIALRHMELGRNVAMFRTSLATTQVGKFAGPMVVSMRPLRAADAIRAVQLSSRYPAVHGAPVHLGDPALIGITDLQCPDYGDAVEVRHDELPVFWACGVTPQAALARARPALAITHAPGAMLVTDLSNEQLVDLSPRQTLNLQGDNT